MSEVDRTELVTDELYGLDVQFISDDDKYFPFEVSIYNSLHAIELCRAFSLQAIDRSVEYIVYSQFLFCVCLVLSCVGNVGN